MIVYIKLLLTALLWGGTFIAGRVVAEDVGPFSAAFFRFFIASIFLVLFTYRIEGKNLKKAAENGPTSPATTRPAIKVPPHNSAVNRSFI